MCWSVILPARSATWARGRPAGGGSVPPQGFGYGLTTSDQIDSAMPLKTHTGRPVWFFAAKPAWWRRRHRRKFSTTMRESPGLPAGRAERFPVSGELCLHATYVAPSLGSMVRVQLVALAISMAFPKGGPGFSQKPSIQPLFLRPGDRLPELRVAALDLAGAATFGATAQSVTFK